jgi:hypothetical protein
MSNIQDVNLRRNCLDLREGSPTLQDIALLKEKHEQMEVMYEPQRDPDDPACLES